MALLSWLILFIENFSLPEMTVANARWMIKLRSRERVRMQGLMCATWENVEMTEPDPVLGDGRNLVYLITQIERGLRRPFISVVRRHGMTAAQYTALTVLNRLPGLTSSELSRRSFVRAQSMAVTVTELLGRGLIRRESDPDHGRQWLLFITDSGLAQIESMADDVLEVERDFTRLMTAQQADALAEALRLGRNALRSGQSSDNT